MKIGVIGGSGLYEMETIQQKRWISVTTPFGKPSDQYLTGRIAGRDIVFLPRHGRGHKILPSELNHRANIYGMKTARRQPYHQHQRCRLAQGRIQTHRHRR